MDLIEEYINNIRGMAMSLDDFGDRKKCRNANQLADRNRKISAKIDKKYPELKERFADLLDSEEMDIRGWAAHSIIELMSYDRAVRLKALKVIEYEAEYSDDSIQRLGNSMWLKRYYEEHPEDKFVHMSV